MSQGKLERSCPVCGRTPKDVIIEINFELLEGHPMNGGYDVVQCTECGFVYANTLVTQSELDFYYAELSKYEDKNLSTGGGFTPQDRDRLQKTAAFISEHVRDKTTRIADLGCANGGLLRELKALEYTNLVGIDPSEACVKITKQEVGCECYQHSLFNIPQGVGKFDLVLLSHVLEHVLDVQTTISVIDELLNPGGQLYIECPNAAYYYKVIHAPLQEFNAEHINHFTESAFQNLMKSFNYEVITTGDKIMKIASDQDYHAVYGLFRKTDASKHRSSSFMFDTSVRQPIEKYIKESNRIFDEIKTQIARLPQNNMIALFGVGQFAFKLLKTEPFAGKRLYKLFDNNSMNVGKKVNGIEIMHSSNLVAEYRKEKFIIIISSLIHEVSIRKNIYQLFEQNGEQAPEVLGFSSLLT
jgi:2-polyprenyl-3-methyl-5-hydroxy-6-metoxy-1,4-benzoquinol methylase